MKTKFDFATIQIGVHKSTDYELKGYSTVQGFKRGLKANGCPFIVDEDGLFQYIDGSRLMRRQWSYAGKQFTATVETSKK